MNYSCSLIDDKRPQVKLLQQAELRKVFNKVDKAKKYVVRSSLTVIYM